MGRAWRTSAAPGARSEPKRGVFFVTAVPPRAAVDGERPLALSPDPDPGMNRRERIIHGVRQRFKDVFWVRRKKLRGTRDHPESFHDLLGGRAPGEHQGAADFQGSL